MTNPAALRLAIARSMEALAEEFLRYAEFARIGRLNVGEAVGDYSWFPICVESELYNADGAPPRQSTWDSLHEYCENWLAQVNQAQSSMPRAAILVGELGTGKTVETARLMRRFAQSASDECVRDRTRLLIPCARTMYYDKHPDVSIDHQIRNYADDSLQRFNLWSDEVNLELIILDGLDEALETYPSRVGEVRQWLSQLVEMAKRRPSPPCIIVSCRQTSEISDAYVSKLLAMYGDGRRRCEPIRLSLLPWDPEQFCEVIQEQLRKQGKQPDEVEHLVNCVRSSDALRSRIMYGFAWSTLTGSLRGIPKEGIQKRFDWVELGLESLLNEAEAEIVRVTHDSSMPVAHDWSMKKRKELAEAVSLLQVLTGEGLRGLSLQQIMEFRGDAAFTILDDVDESVESVLARGCLMTADRRRDINAAVGSATRFTPFHSSVLIHLASGQIHRLLEFSDESSTAGITAVALPTTGEPSDPVRAWLLELFSSLTRHDQSTESPFQHSAIGRLVSVLTRLLTAQDNSGTVGPGPLLAEVLAYWNNARCPRNHWTSQHVPPLPTLATNQMGHEHQLQSLQVLTPLRLNLIEQLNRLRHHGDLESLPHEVAAQVGRARSVFAISTDNETRFSEISEPDQRRSLRQRLQGELKLHMEASLLQDTVFLVDCTTVADAHFARRVVCDETNSDSNVVSISVRELRYYHVDLRIHIITADEVHPFICDTCSTVTVEHIVRGTLLKFGLAETEPVKCRVLLITKQGAEVDLSLSCRLQEVPVLSDDLIQVHLPGFDRPTQHDPIVRPPGDNEGGTRESRVVPTDIVPGSDDSLCDTSLRLTRALLPQVRFLPVDIAQFVVLDELLAIPALVPVWQPQLGPSESTQKIAIENPRHLTFLSRRLVTCGEYVRFLNALVDEGGHDISGAQRPDFLRKTGITWRNNQFVVDSRADEELPVTGLTYEEAAGYVAFLNRRLGEHGIRFCIPSPEMLQVATAGPDMDVPALSGRGRYGHESLTGQIAQFTSAGTAIHPGRNVLAFGGNYKTPGGVKSMHRSQPDLCEPYRDGSRLDLLGIRLGATCDVDKLIAIADIARDGTRRLHDVS